MQVTCPQCRALADRTYDPPLFRRTKCPNCGFELEEVNIKEAIKIAEIVEKEERRIREEFEEACWAEWRKQALEWCKQDREERAKLKPGKIPPEGYWRVPGTLLEWLQILGVKDIDAAEKVVRKTGPFNQWKETAWHLWRKGEI
jgi:hypothetical protein